LQIFVSILVLLDRPLEGVLVIVGVIKKVTDVSILVLLDRPLEEAKHQEIPIHS